MNYKIYNVETINRLSQDFHRRAVDKGFWDKPNTTGHYLMLALGELHEAVEADRLGKWSKLTLEQIEYLQSLQGEEFVKEFLQLVKDTVEDEFADTVIRLLDLLGWLLKTKRTTETINEQDMSKLYGVLDMPGSGEEITQLLMRIVADTSGYWRLGLLREKGILYAIKSIEQLCDHFGIDLMAHIDLKIKYNETRPRLHGKKY